MLEIRNLTKVYENGKKAVDNLSITIESGDIFGFIGSNGAGKTSTIKSVVGIHNFDEGKIFIDGVSIQDDPVLCKSKMAYVPDSPNLYEHLTGISYLNFIADVYKISKDEREKYIREYSDMFEMTHNLGSPISSYSHGMRQRLSIISSLIHHPKLLILDEPFVGLDPKATILLRNAMEELCSKGGAIFFSTHVLEVAQKLCNKIAIIKDGKLVAVGETAKLVGSDSLENVFMEATKNG